MKNYDFVCSLGANCSAAFQIKYRKMRRYALPFDWTAMKEDECLYKLAEGFGNNFKKFLLKENLRKLTDKEFTKAHLDNVQYQDMYTKIYYYNHFQKELDVDNEYNRVKKIYDRRLKRFLQKIETSKNILFVLSSTVNFSTDAIYNLVDTINTIYPDKLIDIHINLFNQKEEKVTTYKNCNIYSYKRNENYYDYAKTNFEWSFLDDIKLKNDTNLIYTFKRIKRGICLNLLPKISSIFIIKLYILGLRLQLIIGKNKNNEY